MKSTLWLHSTTYLKNSGIFVVRASNCVVAGKKTGPAAFSSFSSLASSAATSLAAGTKVSVISGPNYKAAKDVDIGKK